MSVRTQRAFNFTREPFAKDFPIADLFLDEARSRTLETLQGAIEQRFSVLLTAEPGVGKSCLVRRLASQLHPGRVKVQNLHNATLGRRDFYRQLCWGLGLKPSATPAALFRAISQHIEELAAENRGHPVFVLDEAHLLQDATVEILHLLLNYQWDSRPLLSLLLVGLPELKDRLRLHQHRALWTRLAERLHLGPFGPEGTAAYVRHRLAKAGCEREVFASDALALLHEASQGYTRDLDRIAALCLEHAAQTKERLVDRTLVRDLLKAQAA
jgi:type II secretory pathway predicted ATPase ExeA